jgi:hypothetical protein
MGGLCLQHGDYNMKYLKLEPHKGPEREVPKHLSWAADQQILLTYTVSHEPALKIK